MPAKNMLGGEGMTFAYMMDRPNRNRSVIGARLGGTTRCGAGCAQHTAN